MASNNTTNSNFKNRGKDIQYLGKDFSAFRDNLIEFAKIYFPKTYSDFNESSPGMMFIEMASYVGDVLSYYVDDTLKESLMVYADDPGNVIALAQYLGYKPKVASPAVTILTVYQLVPSIGNGVNNKPDSRFYLRIKEGMRSESTNGIIFRTNDAVDFSDSADREISVFQRDVNTGEPTFYLITKNVQAISVIEKTKDVAFGSYQPFQTIQLDDTNVISIYDVRDSNNNKYYEVPYLAQEMVFQDYANTLNTEDKDLYQFRETVPYILKTIKTPRRFTTKVNYDNTTLIQFGSGDPTANDEQLIPNLKNVGLGLPNSISRLEESFDPTNFLKTKTYGTSPSNTTVSIKYWVGGGVASNVPMNSITKITGIEFDDQTAKYTNQELSIYNTAKASVAIDNEVSATGGRGAETIEEIRQNALANFGAQNRAVTERDYQIRALSMPAKYGAIAKVYAIADGKLDNNSPSSILASPNHLQQFTDLVMSYIKKPDNLEPTEATVKSDIRKFLVGKQSNLNEVNNPFAINLYLLGYDENGNLTNLNRAVKENLKTYLNEYRLLTDAININDGFVINIEVEFEVKVFSTYNKSEVVTKCITELKEFFKTDNFGFNQTINLSEIELLLANVEGVISVPVLKIKNLCSGNYSSCAYNIEAATKDKIVYPSLDPCVFELKYPDVDIKGRAK
jgi:hypothetical protein